MRVNDEVKQRTDIVDVVGQYVTLKKAGRNFTGLCPFHGEKTPSFFVFPERQNWHCFGCNTGGDVFAFIMKKEDMDFGDALRFLAQRAGVTIPSKFEPEEGKEEKEELYQINSAAAEYFHDLLLSSPAAEKARSYVANRGFSLQTVADFQLGFSLDSWESAKQHLMQVGYTESSLLKSGIIIEAESGKIYDRFRGRLIFPIRDARGRVAGFGGRVLDDSLPKYLNSPQTIIFDKSSIIYGVDRASGDIRKQDMAVIVEGYIDVITAHQNSICNVVASMGTSITETQVTTLKKLTKNLVLALDADAAGEEAMLRGVGYENTIGSEVKVILLPAGRDPDDVIKEDTGTWQQLVKDATPIVDYTFDMVTAKLDLSAPKGKSLAVERLLPIIADMKDTVRQAHYLQKLAHLANMNVRNLESTLSNIKPRQGAYKAKSPKPETVSRALRPLVSKPQEEYCLTLLLQHPELKAESESLLPEYFENSINREIYTAWQDSDDQKSLKETLDIAIHEYLDSLLNMNLPPAMTEQKFKQCLLRLQEDFLKGIEARNAEILTSESEIGGTEAELAKLEEQGIENSTQLAEVHKRQRQPETRR